MIGFILFTVALILIFLLTIVNYWFVENKSGYFLSTARNLDVFANREFRAFWNKVLRTENGYKFGYEGETISSALGKNLQAGTLTKTGKALVWILSKKHCLDAINE
ncbi:hypothetical protein [Flavobacterium sp.]|uniref:hypothetical protein n=1 Tax=Flavobacterium sp. TaxID=239 RepID=UPI002BBF8AA9|nr:hypothetical protein [Flavobacterium sp.]HSD07902.1 hypothetical protein [Flavobacterium sp.]